MELHVPSTRYKRSHIRLLFALFCTPIIQRTVADDPKIKKHQCRKPGARLAVISSLCIPPTFHGIILLSMQGRPALIAAASSLSNGPRHVSVSCGLCATKRVCGRTQSIDLFRNCKQTSSEPREKSDPDHQRSDLTQNAMNTPCRN